MAPGLMEAARQGQIYIALVNHRCAGFMRVVKRGMFDRFAYLGVLGVKAEFRGRGIGAQLMQRFEEIGFEAGRRVFILVSEFNGSAQRFYARLGYQKLCLMPSLFKNGISEWLLMKEKS